MLAYICCWLDLDPLYGSLYINCGWWCHHVVLLVILYQGFWWCPRDDDDVGIYQDGRSVRLYYLVAMYVNDGSLISMAYLLHLQVVQWPVYIFCHVH